MATATKPAVPEPAARTIIPDTVISLRVEEGALDHYLTLVGGWLHKNPRLKCGEGRITLVSPSRTHEEGRLQRGCFVIQVRSVLMIAVRPPGSTLYAIPGTDRGYMPDESYLIGDRALNKYPKGSVPRPDLVIEIVVSHPEHDALAACAALRGPEVWAWDIPRGRLTFYVLKAGGKDGPRYATAKTSCLLPFLRADEVLARVAEAPDDVGVFVNQCRDFASTTLARRVRARKKRHEN